jgi:hypothetical protein
MTRDGIVMATFTRSAGGRHSCAATSTAMMPGTEDQDIDVPAKALVTGSPEAQAAIAEELDYAVASDKIETKIEENPYGAAVRPRFIVGATWDDAPHLTEKVKAQQWASMLPYQRAARTKGIPSSARRDLSHGRSGDSRRRLRNPGALVARVGDGCGRGAKPTAAVFAALNPEDRVLYITSVYKRASNEPSLHAAAIKERMMRPTGWLWPGVGDAAALIMTQHDAQQLVYVYRRLGLDLYLPDKAVETGIADLWDLMVTGRFKVFASCQAWFEEFRMYRRDARGAS